MHERFGRELYRGKVLKTCIWESYEYAERGLLGKCIRERFKEL